MGWLWLVGSIKLQVSFAKEPYERDNILQKRLIILSILLTTATPYVTWFIRNVTWFIRNVTWFIRNVTWFIRNVTWFIRNVTWFIRNVTWFIRNVTWFIHIWMNHVTLPWRHGQMCGLDRKKPPPRGGFLFTMFPHQEPCVRGPPSKNLVQILRGGSSYSRFLMREYCK